MFEPFVGGAEISLKRLTQGLAATGKVNPLIITSRISETGNLIAGKTIKNGNVVRVGFDSNMLISDANWKKYVAERLTLELIKYRNLDIVYVNSHLFFEFSDSIKRIFSLKKPVVLKIIYTKAFSSLELEKKFLLSENIRKRLHIHCLTKDIKEQAIAFGFEPNQLFICPNAVDTVQFRLKQPKDRFVLKKYGISDIDIVFVFTGRFSPQKNLEKIGEIFASVEEKRNAKLLMIGYANHPGMDKVITSLKKLSKNILWLDKVPNKNISQYLRAADCFIMASRDEGLSNSLLEAMSSGLCPVVPEDISGMQDFIQKGVSGILYDTANIKRLVDRLVQISVPEIKIMGIAARRNIEINCSIERVVSLHINFYRSLVDRSSVAFCIVAHNEANNIRDLLERTIQEYFPKNIQKNVIVYTDASTDKTAKYVDEYVQKYPTIVKHIKESKRAGKVAGVNSILRKIQAEYLFFLDGDITYSAGVPYALWRNLVNQPSVKAISPVFMPFEESKSLCGNIITRMRKKTKLHHAKYGKHKYISGRMYCIHRNAMKEIPEESMYDDIYINLILNSNEIAIAKDCVVYYRPPDCINDVVRYHIRTGCALASIKKNFPLLWQEQQRRLPLVEYALFGLTKSHFIEFFNNLTFAEKIAFFVIRGISALAMFYGFLTFQTVKNVWEPLQSTKKSV